MSNRDSSPRRVSAQRIAWLLSGLLMPAVLTWAPLAAAKTERCLVINGAQCQLRQSAGRAGRRIHWRHAVGARQLRWHHHHQ
jgi:hypothetical protein